MTAVVCPVVDTADGITLRCILPTGHPGPHLADTIEEQQP